MTAPSIIESTFPEARTATDAFIRDGMSPIELNALRTIVLRYRPTSVLEVGMANGTSSVVIADAMAGTRNAHLTSIDPNQTKAVQQGGYGSAGLRAVNGLPASHRLIETFDFLALPQLLAEGQRFDMILVDGFHSFDLTQLDLFYADQLLTVGGLLLCHDSSSPAVYKALRWLEANKPYQRLSPPLYSECQPILQRLWNKLTKRAERRERQTNWQMLVAYRKQADHSMKEHELTEF